MEAPRFDALARALGAGRTRRGVVGLLAALVAGGAVTQAEARRRRCRRDSPPGQCCRKQDGIISCTCDNDGTVCGADCCLLGEECRDGQCVELPEPTTCVEFGEPCKNVGRPCCAGLACGSGQGGQGDVACYVPAGGACATTAECVFGSECRMGLCVANPVCTVPLGEVCGPTDICCAGTCGVVLIGARIPEETRCCAAIGQACGRDQDCCTLLNGTGRWPRGIVAIQCVSGVCRDVSD